MCSRGQPSTERSSCIFSIIATKKNDIFRSTVSLKYVVWASSPCVVCGMSVVHHLLILFPALVCQLWQVYTCPTSYLSLLSSPWCHATGIIPSSFHSSVPPLFWRPSQRFPHRWDAAFPWPSAVVRKLFFIFIVILVGLWGAAVCFYI